MEPPETIFTKAGFLVEPRTIIGTRKPTRSQQPHCYNTIQQNCQGTGQAGDTEGVVGQTQSKYHPDILFCADSAATGSPKWQYAACCQGGDGG